MRSVKSLFPLLILFLAACSTATASPTVLPEATPTPTLTPAPTPTQEPPFVLSAGSDSGIVPANILPRLGEFYRSDPALECGGSSPELRRALAGATVSPALTQVDWCACNLRGTVKAALILPDGSLQPLEGRQSLAYSTCYTWNYLLGPQAARGAYKMEVSYRGGQLTDAFTVELPAVPQAVWLEAQNLIWSGGFLPGESVRLLVFSGLQEDPMQSESAYTLLYQFENIAQADASGELWIDLGSPAVSASYRLVILDGYSGRAQAGRSIPPTAAEVLAGHVFNNCDGQSTSLRVGQSAHAALPLTEVFLSSLLLDDEVLDTLPQGEEITILDGPICDRGGWLWKVSARKGALQGWMTDTSLAP